MRKKILRFVVMPILLAVLLFCPSLQTLAANSYTNADTGYRALIEDHADLLSRGHEDDLLETMKGITAYGNVAFKSVDTNNSTTAALAESYYRSVFGKDSGTVFLIDMDNRMIYIFSDGKVYRTITKAYANTITDNVYRYASQGDYYTCANEAFLQMQKLLDGGRIMQPMKYINNALLALLLAFLVVFGYICIYSRHKQPTDTELLKRIHKQFSAGNASATFTHETKIYSPPSSDSGGGGSSGGGGGGGSSGGGGGHSF